MGHLVAAPDKFRGTASATEVAEAAAAGARSHGWSADVVPLADGGEGLLEVVGGRPMQATVTGPDGRPRSAEWRLLEMPPVATGPHGPAAPPVTAVIEMAQAAGLVLAGGPETNDPVRATTAGVGELILAAVDAGARRVLVGCGGSATTDGGAGAVDAVGSPARLRGAELVVACDVTTPFVDAARIFGPQKGATSEMVELLTDRLRTVAQRYRSELGVDVEVLSGAGAAGGLAGGLAALGARLAPGFPLVAELVGLADRMAGADLVVTGEGRLDRTSLAGKVVGGVVALAAPGTPVLCVVGDADPDVLADGPWGPESALALPAGATPPAVLPAGGATGSGMAGSVVSGRAMRLGRSCPVRVVRLVAEFGDARAHQEVPALVEAVVEQVVTDHRLLGTAPSPP